MMDRKRAEWMVKWILILIVGASLTGCTGPKYFVMMENSMRTDLRVPADFTIKVTGETIYTYQDTTLPAGDILKEKLEEYLNKIQGFSVNKGYGNQYLVGIDILKYDPKIDPEKKDIALYQYPDLWYEVIVCVIEKGEKGDQIIGKKLFGMPFNRNTHGSGGGTGGISLRGISVADIIHGAMTSSTAWRTVIENAAKDISNALEDTFKKQ